MSVAEEHFETDGFPQVWLLPFLYFGYVFELYNAYTLYTIHSTMPDVSTNFLSIKK